MTIVPGEVETKVCALALSRVFLITTEGARELAEMISDRLRVTSVEVVNSFDFRQKERSEVLDHIDRRTFLRHYGQLPTNGAVGCALAHRYCYSRIMEENLSDALILEDDVVPESLNRDVLATLSRLRNFDVISLGSVHAMVKRSPCGQFGAYSLHKWTHYSFGTYAYLISHTGAEKLLRAQEPRIRRLADWPLDPAELDLFLLIPAMAQLSGRQSGVVCRSGQAEKIPLIDLVRFYAQSRLWRLTGTVRTALLGDLRIG